MIERELNLYRLAYNPGTGDIVQVAVSELLVDMIDIIFGPVDSNGCFEDTDRVKAFMENSCYLCELVGKTYKNSCDGSFCLVVPWEHIIKTRYEDIRRKIRDTEHEYTFNEIGEGLIHLLLDFILDSRCLYLESYPDNEGRFDDDLWIGGDTLLARGTYFPGLYSSLREASGSVYASLKEADFFTEFAELDEDAFAFCYVTFWGHYLRHYGCFTVAGEGCDFSLIFGEDCFSPYLHGDDAEELACILFYDLIFWDNDFDFLLPLLGDPDALAEKLEVLSPIGLISSDAKKAIIGFDDNVFDLSPNCEQAPNTTYADIYGTDFLELKKAILSGKLTSHELDELFFYSAELHHNNVLSDIQHDELTSCVLEMFRNM